MTLLLYHLMNSGKYVRRWKRSSYTCTFKTAALHMCKFTFTSCYVIYISIGSSNNQTIIATVYSPPDTPKLYSNGMFKYLTRLSTKANELMLFGDYVIIPQLIGWPHIILYWMILMMLFKHLSKNRLSQLLFNVPTRCINMFDLVLFSILKCVASLDVLPPLTNSDHCIIIIKLKLYWRIR